MKNLFVFMLLAFLLCGLNFGFCNKFTLSSIFPNFKAEIFTSNKTLNSGYYKIDNGMGEIIFCSEKDFANIYNNTNYITGFTIRAGTINKDEVIKKLNAYNVLKVNNCIYAYSPVLQKLLEQKNIKSVCINNKYYNLQINTISGEQIIGCPINLGSF